MNRQASRPKKTYHHGDLQQALLKEAASILRHQGEEALTMRGLAAAAGVSRTAPYHHFRNKQVLLSALAEEGFRLFDQQVFDPLRVKDGPPPRERMRNFVSDWVHFATENQEFYNLMYGANVWRRGRSEDQHAAEARRAFRRSVNDMRFWQERGVLSDQANPRHIAQVVWASLHGLSRLLIDGIYMKSDFSEAMRDAVADMLWRELERE